VIDYVLIVYRMLLSIHKHPV